jgi:hypothetical protein
MSSLRTAGHRENIVGRSRAANAFDLLKGRNHALDYIKRRQVDRH